MNSRTTFWNGALAITFTAVLGASPAFAQLSEAEVDCRTAIAKNYQKLVKTAEKTITGCHKARNKAGGADIDCNNIAVADVSDKFSTAAVKFTDAVAMACSSVNLTAEGLGDELYVTCPVTCAVPNPLTDMSEVATCLVCVASDYAGDVAAATLGLPAQGLSAEEQKCHGAIAKGYTKYLQTALKAETACQKAQDESGNSDITGCIDDDPTLKVAGALAKAGEGLDKSCVGATVADLDSCAATTVADLKTCNATEWEANDDLNFQAIYGGGFESDHCPTAIRTTILGGCSTQDTGGGACLVGNQSGTVLSVGWKGAGHSIDVTDSYTLAGAITCPGTLGACGECTIDGISSDSPQYYDFTRCTDDPSRICDNPFGLDQDCGSCLGGANPHPNCTSNADCTGGNTCQASACSYFLGPPLAVNAGVATCTLNIVEQDITGTVDPDAGSTAFTVNLRARVHTGTSALRPCPYCVGDPAPQDHNRTGICDGGTNDNAVCDNDTTCTGGGDCVGNFGTCTGGSPRDGSPCDVQGFDLTFVPTNPNAPTDGLSLDCAPVLGQSISGAGLRITLPLTTGTAAKPAQDACEAPNSGLNCFCGSCSGDTSIGCNTDAECALLGAGICGASGGVSRKPNDCTGGVCTAQPGLTDRGLCDTLPDLDRYCDGVLMANGRGLIPCADQSYCDASDSICPSKCDGGINDSQSCDSIDDCDGQPCIGNCGSCTFDQIRGCFLDPITLTGVEDTERPILVGTFCLPPSSNVGVNSTVGTPGPGTVQTDTIVQKRY